MFQAYVGIFLGFFGAALIFIECSTLLKFSWMFPLKIEVLAPNFKRIFFPDPPWLNTSITPPFSIGLQSQGSPRERNSR